MNRSIIGRVGDEMENEDPSMVQSGQKSKLRSGRLAHRKKRFSFDPSLVQKGSNGTPLASIETQENKKKSRASLGSYLAEQNHQRPSSPTPTETETVLTNLSTVTRGRLTRFVKEKNSKTKVSKSEKTRSDSDPLCPKVLRVRIRNILAGSEPISKEEVESAIKIQCAVRVYLAMRKTFLSFYARTLQANWRGYYARKCLKEANEKATKIQARWRSYDARTSYLCYTGSIKIQSAWRCYSARQKFLHHQKIDQAAISIQTAWRSFFAYYSFAFTVHCVIIVQKLQRGRVGRKICNDLSTRSQRQKLIRNSAITIQRHYRGLAGRTKCMNIRYENWLHDCMARFQARWRAYSEQRKFWYTVSSAIKIQSFARGATQQMRYLDMVWAAVLLQGIIRGWLARANFKKTFKQYFLNKAATKIQSTWRASVARENYFLHDSARKIQRAWKSYRNYCDLLIFAEVQRIQAAWRGYSMRIKYIHTLTAIRAATKIQCAWRLFMCRGDYIFTIMDIITVQRLVRGIAGRKRFKEKAEIREQERALAKLRWSSALMIQRVFRGYIGRIEYDEIFEAQQQEDAAILIQTVWRRYDAETRLWQTIDCVIQIQSVMRGILARYQFADRLGSIIVVQSIARRWSALKQARCLRFAKSLDHEAKILGFTNRRAALVLQDFYWDIVKPQYTLKCAIKIQSFFRMVKAMVDVYMISEMKRKEERKERKLREERLKNRDDNIENLMLEEAWSKSMQCSDKDDKVQQMLETMTVSESVKKPEATKKSGRRKSNARSSKRSKGRAHLKKKTRAGNIVRASERSVPKNKTTCKSADDKITGEKNFESVLEDALLECENGKNQQQNLDGALEKCEENENADQQEVTEPKNETDEISNTEDDDSVVSFTSSIATKTSMRLDQTWEFTYGQSNDLQNLGLESVASTQSFAKSSKKSKKPSNRSRSKDPPERVPSDSSVRRSNNGNAQKDKMAKKISTQEQMLNRISSTNVDEAMSDVLEVASRDPPESLPTKRRTKESKTEKNQKCKIVSSSPTADKRSTKLSNKENDALDEAWEVMLVDAESQQKLEGTISSDNSTQMESRAQPPRSRSRSTSRSKMRELRAESPVQPTRRSRSRSKSNRKSRVPSNSPLREKPQNSLKSESRSEALEKESQSKGDESKSKGTIESLETNTSSRRSRPASRSKPRFHVRSKSPMQKSVENSSEADSGNARHRSMSPALQTHQLQKETESEVAKPPSNPIQSVSPFKKQQDIVSQIMSDTKPRGRSRSTCGVPPNSRFRARSSSPFQKQQNHNAGLTESLTQSQKAPNESQETAGSDSRGRSRFHSKGRFQNRSPSPFQNQSKASPSSLKKVSKETNDVTPQRLNKRYGMPPKSRFNVRSRSPSTFMKKEQPEKSKQTDSDKDSKLIRSVSPSSSKGDSNAIVKTSEPVKSNTRARSVSPANVTECPTDSSCDLTASSSSMNRLPPSNVSSSARGRSRSRSRADVLQSKSSRSCSRSRNDDFDKILVDLD